MGRVHGDYGIHVVSMKWATLSQKWGVLRIMSISSWQMVEHLMKHIRNSLKYSRMAKCLTYRMGDSLKVA